MEFLPHLSVENRRYLAISTHFDVHDFVICKTFPRDQLPNGAERLIAGFEPPVGVFHEPVFRMSER